MEAVVTDSILPVLTIRLDPGEGLLAAPSAFSWKSVNVLLEASAAGLGAAGLAGAALRALGGGGLFLNEFRASDAPGSIAFAAKTPGRILEHGVGGVEAYLLHRHGFLCATPGVTLTTNITRRLGAGLFGGDGFRLQRVAGHGRFWSELGGEQTIIDLASGEALDVHPGHIGMFEEGVGFTARLVPGMKTKLVGGDGLFLARLTGPGRVWLQSLTLSGLARALKPYLPGRRLTPAGS
jgi:uncharacterized protein (TIGR00266 family)